MKPQQLFFLLAVTLLTNQSFALSLSPEEFEASRNMACVLVQQELGLLDEREYGARTHEVLDGFDESERNMIIAKALGYYDGLMFSAEQTKGKAAAARRLRQFVYSNSCSQGSLQQSLYL